MLKNILFILLLSPVICLGQASVTAHFNWSVAQLKNKDTKNILVTAHRCDWRNSPENSVQALKGSIAMGVDIAEFDMGKTSDNVLVIMHDNTVDRTTTGKGKPSAYTLAEIKKLRLRSGTGHPTVHTIPTFDEMLQEARGRIIIDIDKGYEYYDEIVEKLTQQQMLDQAILNIYGLPLDTVKAQHKNIPANLTLQVIVNPKQANAAQVIASYGGRPNTLIQITFAEDDNALLKKVPELKKSYAIWFNSLWPEQSGGHDDDTAVEQQKPDQSWGWLINKGANILQSDRPKELLNYLRIKKLHI